MLKLISRFRARWQLRRMEPKHAAVLLKVIIEHRVTVDPKIMASIADRAATDASGTALTILERIAETYRAGREVKFGNYPVTFLREGETPELVLSVESALKEMSNDDNDG